MKYIFILISCLVISACTKIMFGAANTPALTYHGDIIEDISYGELNRQTLDIYIPEQKSESALPVIIFFHGGKWTFGNKRQYKFVGMTLSQLGYVVVLPNTRLFPEVKFPTFIEDGAKAMSWVHNNIGQYGGSTDIFVSGHSSGAHIGSLVLADERYLQSYGLNAKAFKGFIGMAGPYDFLPNTKELIDIFGPPIQFPDMVVSNFIDGDEPPMLLMYSKNDDTVHIRNLEKLSHAIKEKNGAVSSIIYETGDHTATVAALSWANPADLPIAQDMHQFMQNLLVD